MPVYRNPDFRRLPDGLDAIFAAAADDSFFALPGWYDLMARHGVPPATETRIYSDERTGSAAALVLQVVDSGSGRRLASLTNAYSVEHGVLCAPATDAATGLDKILGTILDESPRWTPSHWKSSIRVQRPIAPPRPLCAVPVFSSNACSTPGPGTRKRRV